MEKADWGITLITPQSRTALCEQLKLEPRELMMRLDLFLRNFNNK